MVATLRSWLQAALVALLLFAPRAALACPVCTGGQKEEVGRALFRGSLVLSLLPLAAVGAVAWWLRRRARMLASSAATHDARSPREATGLIH